MPKVSACWSIRCHSLVCQDKQTTCFRNLKSFAVQNFQKWTRDGQGKILKAMANVPWDIQILNLPLTVYLIFTLAIPELDIRMLQGSTHWICIIPWNLNLYIHRFTVHLFIDIFKISNTDLEFCVIEVYSSLNAMNNLKTFRVGYSNITGTDWFDMIP